MMNSIMAETITSTDPLMNAEDHWYMTGTFLGYSMSQTDLVLSSYSEVVYNTVENVNSIGTFLAVMDIPEEVILSFLVNFSHCLVPVDLKYQKIHETFIKRLQKAVLKGIMNKYDTEVDITDHFHDFVNSLLITAGDKYSEYVLGRYKLPKIVLKNYNMPIFKNGRHYEIVKLPGTRENSGLYSSRMRWM